jgi:hypothetical protein
MHPLGLREQRIGAVLETGRLGALRQEKKFNHQLHCVRPYIYKKASSTTEIEKTNVEKKQMNYKSKHKNYRVYARINSCNWFLEVKNYYSGHHGLVAKKIKPVSRSCGTLNRKIIDSLRINPQAKIITLGDLNDGAYNKSVKVALGAKAKKTDVPKLESTIHSDMAKRFWNHCDAWDILTRSWFLKP